MEPEEVLTISEPKLGLSAVLVIDSTALGPAAGGTRTFPYRSLADATADARALARAMTLKCAIGGLQAGGGKCVVVDHPGLDRPRAFAYLGAEMQKLKGRFRSGGDFGTGPAETAAMAGTCEYIHCEGSAIGDAVARGVVACAGIAWSTVSGKDLASARVLVQGCGEVGAPVARAFAARGARLFLTDLDDWRAASLAADLGARVLAPGEAFSAKVDILSPCAMGGVLTEAALSRMSASIVCGAANNIFASPELPARYHERYVLVVPDFLASAGGVIYGIARSVMGMVDPNPLIAGLRETTRAVLAESGEDDEAPHTVAERLAWARIHKARR